MIAVIEFDNLQVQLGGRPILHGLTGSFSGHSIGLLGPNGAGKSTLINTLLGFYKPAGGTARLFGQDIRSHARSLRRLIGYMPENDAFIAGMSAVRFVRMMAELSGLPREEAIERAHEAFYYVGLGEARYRPLGSYSLGMKQMAKLAQAIVHGPKLVLLDEPTNGLDPAARSRMIRLIRDIRETGRVHLIISSHLLRDVEECCEEVIILKDGRIAASCNLAEERRSNLNLVELETSGNCIAFESRMAQLGCDYATAGAGRFRVVLPDNVSARELFRAAADTRTPIRKFQHRVDSLQDIFLKAMEGGSVPPETLNGRP